MSNSERLALVEELRRLYRLDIKPFRPIEFELADGRTFVIPRRGALQISEDGSWCGFVKHDGDLNSPDPFERGEERLRFRGDQIVRVGYAIRTNPGEERSAG